MWVNTTAKRFFVFAGGTNWILSGGTTQGVSVASANSSLSTRVGQSTSTGLTTASGAVQVFVITNSLVTAPNQPILLSVTNDGTNDAFMTIQRVKLTPGFITVTLRNNGPQALNGNVHINWILNS
jgi:hypothetical protein